MACEGFSPAQRKTMLLSQETRDSLRMTSMSINCDYTSIIVPAAHSFIELVRYLFKIPGVTIFLSRRICQDPIEIFFGCQRQRGGTHDNPTVLEYQQNTQSLRVVNSFCRNIAKGNCRGNKENTDIFEKESSPLPRRKTTKPHKDAQDERTSDVRANGLSHSEGDSGGSAGECFYYILIYVSSLCCS